MKNKLHHLSKTTRKSGVSYGLLIFMLIGGLVPGQALCGCASADKGQTAAIVSGETEKKSIGVIAAMESEMNALVSRMSDVKEVVIGSSKFAQGKLAGKEMVVGLSGIGKTAAARTTTAMILGFEPEAVINVGVAGGLLDSQNVCDLVISDSMIQADFDLSPIDGPSGIGLQYKADEKLMKLAEQAAKELGVNYSVGAIASQDLFMARDEDFNKLMNQFPQSVCSEMEGAAVASAAAAFNVPVLVLRSLSDVVHHQDNPMEYSQFEETAAQRAADLMEKMCPQL